MFLIKCMGNCGSGFLNIKFIGFILCVIILKQLVKKLLKVVIILIERFLIGYFKLVDNIQGYFFIVKIDLGIKLE